MVIFALLACSDAPEPSPPPAALRCAEVTGTTAVWLASREDPRDLVGPDPALPVEDWATGLTGPTADGAYWLADAGQLKRSDDEGCTWTVTGALPSDSVSLVASAASNLVVASDGDAWSTTDGATWTALALPPMQAGLPLALDPTDPLRMRAHVVDGIATSTDGGATWTVDAAPQPDGGWYNAAFDATDVDRIALARDALWTTPDGGATWTEQPDGPAVAVLWDDGVLYGFSHGDDDDADYHLAVSYDLGATFADTAIATVDPALNLTQVAVDDGFVVSAGFRWEVGADVEGVVQVGWDVPVVHRLPGYIGAAGSAFAPTHAIVALQGPGGVRTVTN